MNPAPFYVHFDASGKGIGPFLTLSFKSKRKAQAAVREAKRQGEGARLQEVTP